MTTSTIGKAALPASVLVTLGVLLAGCSGGGAATPSPGPTTSPVTVSDPDLGKALDKLVFQGTGERSDDGGACLVEAVRRKQISDAGLAYIVERDSDDIGAVAEALREVDSMDAAILLSPDLREGFDACVDAVILSWPGRGQTYASPKPAEKPTEAVPNLQSKYPVPEGTVINTSSQLTAGLVSMFSSYALDDAQKEIYQAAGECFSGVAFEAGLSQAALRFLAGGAPIGTGSIADHLPKAEDRAIWESKGFTAALVDCAVNAQPSGETT